jgi:hypothetical protein
MALQPCLIQVPFVGCHISLKNFHEHTFADSRRSNCRIWTLTSAVLVSYHRDSRLLISFKRIRNQITARIALRKFILHAYEHAFHRRCRCNKFCAAASAFVFFNSTVIGAKPSMPDAAIGSCRFHALSNRAFCSAA